jgi:adenylosuccinate synthase
MARGKIDVLMGAQRGDEGKGRFIDILACHYGVIARYNGGSNAGHTIIAGGKEIALHQIPSGITKPHIFNLMTHSVLFDPIKFAAERSDLQAVGYSVSPDNVMVGHNAYVVMPHHKLLDTRRENSSADRQGSTSSGIAYAAADKYKRLGGNAYLVQHKLSRLGELAAQGLGEYNLIATNDEGFEPADVTTEVDQWLTQIDEAEIAGYIGDTDEYVQTAMAAGQNILAEGAQAALLDITRGRVPLTTSSHTGIAGVLDGLGVGPRDIGKVTGVVKLFPSHVGDGHFMTRINDEETAEVIRGGRGDADGEYGKTTGRERQVGWLDLPVLRSAIRHNGVSEIILTKLDVAERLHKIKLGSIPVITSYMTRSGDAVLHSPPSEDDIREMGVILRNFKLWEGSVRDTRQRQNLPLEARDLLQFIERETRTPIVMVGVGPGPDEYVKG